eukprot:TRINITY_DN6431_c2_g2_i2.p1 TRINITY_DN6431_c2_g2~~TRINITY_DN6431_c2_g2_i2.p1  ORF type:complete len:119 (+),score=11.86 TRINITY_DN6431_c2_g2_i2:198-554(+)
MADCPFGAPFSASLRENISTLRIVKAADVEAGVVAILFDEGSYSFISVQTLYFELISLENNGAVVTLDFESPGNGETMTFRDCLINNGIALKTGEKMALREDDRWKMALREDDRWVYQ